MVLHERDKTVPEGHKTRKTKTLQIIIIIIIIIIILIECAFVATWDTHLSLSEYGRHSANCTTL